MKGNSKNIAKKTLNIILDILIVMLGIILIITIYNNIQIKILGNDYASFFGYSVFEVQTGSMEPEISAGDWIIVKYKKNIELNDIVTFEYKDEFITHRVIEKYNGTYVTKGDANTAKDSPINKEQIVGSVSKILPNFGVLRKIFFNPIIILFLIITCYIAMQTFKKPSEKEIEIEKELMDKIKNKIPRKKIKIKVKRKKVATIDDEMEDIFSDNDVVSENIKETIEEQKTVVEEETEHQEEIEQQEEIKNVTEENSDIETNSTDDQEEVELNEEELHFENQDEMEKTVFYRMVSVSEEELSSAYNTPVMIEENIEEPKKEEVIEITENEVKSTLELIQKKKKKSKNFIEKVMLIKQEEIEEIINIILQNEKEKTNEPTIKEKLIKSYIDAKYYNYCGDINLEYNNKNMNSKIEEAIKEIAKEMKTKYKGSDKKYNEKVDKYTSLILLINHLEQEFKKEETTEEKKEVYTKYFDKYFKLELKDKDFKTLLSKIIKSQKKYNGVIKFLLNKLETGIFELKINNIKEKNSFAVELLHNIQFSKIYSEYIVDKTYSEGVVAEDKIEVLASLLQAQLVKDMFNGVFNNKYIIYLPETLYEKDKKIEKVLTYFDDQFAKNCINFLVKFEAIDQNKKIIKALAKTGYKFSTDLTNVDKIKKTEEPILHIMDYIFVTKTNNIEKHIKELLPEALISKVVYEEIASKVGNF